ncbi:MAG: GTP-binding protein [Alphaproteobacteria bacterium]
MAVETGAEPIPTLLLTGFLGSGKTTVLNAVLRAPEMRETAVLVNEFGAVGIDHLLVEALDDDVVLLNAGCLCCTIRGDIVDSLSSLFERRASGTIPAFRRAIIETTGLADPAPILHTLLSHEAVRERYRMDAIVATVDAVNGDRQLSEHDESVKQVAVADRLLITKSDLAGRSSVDALRARLEAINPAAPIAVAVHGSIKSGSSIGHMLFEKDGGPVDVNRWLAAAEGARSSDGHGHDAHGTSRHDDRIRQLSIETGEVIEAHRLIGWIERLLATEGDRVLRLKGVLDLKGSDVPVVVHGVQHVFHPLARLARWPGGERRSRLVIIAKDLALDSVEESFRRSVLARP